MMAATLCHAAQYSYNHRTGKCQDGNGNEGLNHLIPEQIFAPPEVVDLPNRVVYRNRNGECTDFTEVDFNEKLRKDQFAMMYITLENWNLNGARLKGAKIFFYNGDLSLKGVDLSEIYGGYIDLRIKFDQFTRSLVNCQPNSDGSCNWRK